MTTPASHPDAPTPDRKVVRSTIRCPSGGLVVLDAGRLMAATPEEFAALQARLHAAAGRVTPRGRPFRSAREETGIGPVFVAPVAARDAPHIVKVVRESGRPSRMVIELDGPDPASPVPLGGTPGPDPLAHEATPPGPPDDIGGSQLAGLAAAMGALLLSASLVVSGCGERNRTAEAPPTIEDASTLPPRVVIHPDRYLELAKQAEDEALPLDARVAALDELAGAGPQASLVVPTLQRLAAEGQPAIREAARAALRRIHERIPD